MAINLVRYFDEDLVRWGAVAEGKVYPLEDTYPSLGGFLPGALKKAREALESDSSLPEEEVKILNPITPPCQIICQGKNYLDHILETGVRPQDKDYNLFFTKAPSTLNGPFSPVQRPENVQLLDYEIELALVIKEAITTPQAITEENLHYFIAGLVMANDISARDIQIPQRQWYKGKSFRTFCPVGPYLCLLEAEDIPLLKDLNLTLKVNGDIRQQASTRQMIYRPEETLTELSQIQDLYPGDIILTGTPGGVAFNLSSKEKGKGKSLSRKEKIELLIEDQLDSGRYLQDGDKVEATIQSEEGEIDLGKQSFVIRGE